LNEVLYFLDEISPNNETNLHSSLQIFNGLVAETQETFQSSEEEKINSKECILKPQNISKFIESLGRPPASLSEATLMLTSMLDYDDCSDIPTVKIESFNKEIITFAKKNNLLKDFK
jgi:hypothetical protein